MYCNAHYWDCNGCNIIDWFLVMHYITALQQKARHYCNSPNTASKTIGSFEINCALPGKWRRSGCKDSWGKQKNKPSQCKIKISPNSQRKFLENVMLLIQHLNQSAFRSEESLAFLLMPFSFCSQWRATKSKLGSNLTCMQGFSAGLAPLDWST